MLIDEILHGVYTERSRRVQNDKIHILPLHSTLTKPYSECREHFWYLANGVLVLLFPRIHRRRARGKLSILSW